MNHYEITEVRRTWELASSRMPLFAQLFCIRMQLLDTRHRVLFGDNAETNARMLLRLVGIAVNGLNQPRILFPLLETLGRQNARRIINAQQSLVIIRALLWSLKATLGPSYNSTVRHAWIAGYRAVAKAMAVGMAEAESDSRWDAAPEIHPIAFGKMTIHLMRRSTAPANLAAPRQAVA
ncbi:MAG: hypothetical protein PHQ05_09530 [Sterolibacterium sp.]|nr:hypothetical protein [Sterolibacterium sp.]